MVFFGDMPPFSSQDFLARCSGVLAQKDFAILATIMVGEQATGNAFADIWSARETQVRNAVAGFRAIRLGVDARGFEREHAGYDVSLAQAVAGALAQPTALLREQDIDRARWQLAEELALGDRFGLGAVLAFAVQLRIAERWARLTDVAGQRTFDGLLQAMTELPYPVAVGGEPRRRNAEGDPLSSDGAERTAEGGSTIAAIRIASKP